MHRVPFAQSVPLNEALHLSASTASTPELEACLARHCRGCVLCQNAQWNKQHRQFKDLLAQLAALREAAADVERQLHETADARYDACTHFW
eukprot:3913369-Rhodomonas_salina.1